MQRVPDFGLPRGLPNLSRAMPFSARASLRMLSGVAYLIFWRALCRTTVCCWPNATIFRPSWMRGTAPIPAQSPTWPGIKPSCAILAIWSPNPRLSPLARKMSTRKSQRWLGRSLWCQASMIASSSTPPMRAGAAYMTRFTVPTSCQHPPHGPVAMTPTEATRSLLMRAIFSMTPFRVGRRL